MQCWELPPTKISVQPRLPRAAHKNTWVWCWNGIHGASFHGKLKRGCEQNYFPSCQGAHSGPKGSHDVNSITCTTQFMSLLPFPSLLTCKRNFLDEKQVQQVHQELQGCALRAAFSPAANDTISLHTQVFCLRYFLHSCNAPKAAAPSCQVPKIIQRALLGKHQHRAPPAQIFPGCL